MMNSGAPMTGRRSFPRNDFGDMAFAPSSLSDWGFGGGDFSGLKRVAGWDRLQARLRGGIWVASRTLALLAVGCWAAVQAGARTNIRFRFHAMVTRLHSARTLSRPRNEN